jgi:hypothetical protein
MEEKRIMVSKCLTCGSYFRLTTEPYCYQADAIKASARLMKTGNVEISMIPWDPKTVMYKRNYCCGKSKRAARRISDFFKIGDEVTYVRFDWHGVVFKVSHTSVDVRYADCKVKYKDIKIDGFLKELINNTTPNITE